MLIDRTEMWDLVQEIEDAIVAGELDDAMSCLDGLRNFLEAIPVEYCE